MIVMLAGGVCASTLILGFSRLLSSDQLSIVGNTGEDSELFGMRICPDLDTILYTLCGKVNSETGWGIEKDSFHCPKALQELGGEGWFQLGDRDLATHIWRTSLLKQGHSLTQVTDRL